MKRAVQIFRIIMSIVAVISLVSLVVYTPWNAVRAWAAPVPDTVQEQVDEAVDYGLDGIIIYIDQAGKPPTLYTAGWKNKATHTPADPQALFKIASISKLYMAAATAKLVNDQRLSLDDTLANLLPELVGRIEYADQITLRMLLQHRSGIPNFTDDEAFSWADPPTDTNQYLGLVLDDPADFKPDTNYSYSNTNYLLIGKVLDKVLGYDHQQYIKSEILVPLGLTHTYGTLSQADFEKVVSGYDDHNDVDLKGLDYISPGGTMVATAQDVGIFLRALNDGSLLDPDEQAIYSSIYEYEHTGWLPGYESIARYHQDIDTVVIQFVNSTGGDTWTVSEIVYNRIVDILRR